MLTLVDTSVWIDHFRRGNKKLSKLLEQNEALIHPLVIGELACGNLRNREEILENLNRIPQAKVLTNEETLQFNRLRKLGGRGVGIVDVHLLGASLLSNAQLYTLDKKLDRLFASLR